MVGTAALSRAHCDMQLRSDSKVPVQPGLGDGPQSVGGRRTGRGGESGPAAPWLLGPGGRHSVLKVLVELTETLPLAEGPGPPLISIWTATRPVIQPSRV